jgi:Transcriptional regulator
MDVHQLELLLAVIDSPTMTRAAEKVHLSTAAVSLQCKSLSRELNTELFVRSGRTLVPTPAARRLAEHARNVLAQFRKIEQEFANDPVRDSRPFHFATGATTLIYRLAKPLRALRHKYPNIDLHMSVLPTEEIVAGLVDRQFDLGLVSLPVVNENLALRAIVRRRTAARPALANARSRTSHRVG